MLYGDWGTSRLYVLGLAFFATGVESAYFMLAIAALMIAVAWAYTVVCRSFPEGGGVYSAARAIHPVLSVLGATLLLCGYIITAVISVVEALHYLGVPDGPWIPALGVILLLGVGALNWFGARSAGAFAMIVAAAGIGVSLVLAAACLPHLREGFGRISFNTGGSFWPRWTSFTQWPCARVARTREQRDPGQSTVRATTPRSCETWTATGSKRSFIAETVVRRRGSA